MTATKNGAVKLRFLQDIDDPKNPIKEGQIVDVEYDKHQQYILGGAAEYVNRGRIKTEYNVPIMDGNKQIATLLDFDKNKFSIKDKDGKIIFPHTQTGKVWYTSPYYRKQIAKVFVEKCELSKDQADNITNTMCDEAGKKLKDKPVFKGEKEEDTAIYTSSFGLPGGKYLEEILTDGVERFVLYDKKTDKWTVIDSYTYGDTVIKPYPIDMEQRDAVILPDGIEEYGTLLELEKEMLDFALEEYDPVDNSELYELAIILTLSSWVLPDWQKHMAEKFIPILNARGPSETGKKRFLTITRWLTYHSLYGLKTIRVPTLFRAIAPLHGTLILDEADLNDSSLSSELVEFLNSRCDGVPIPRYSTDEKKVEYWNSFGMTILATRAGFVDDGLESRCVVMPTSTTDNPENYHLIPPNKWMEKGKLLQRKLLLFKLRHSDGKMPTQLTIQNVSSFRVRESLLITEALKEEDPTLLERVKKLALTLQERIIKERAAGPEGLVLNIIYNTLTDSNVGLEMSGLGHIIIMTVKKKDETFSFPLTLRSISTSLGDAFSHSQIARMWRGLNQDTVGQIRYEGKRFRGVIQIKSIKRLDKIFPKYVPNYAMPGAFTIELIQPVVEKKRNNKPKHIEVNEKKTGVFEL